jgi:hypothetical protein
LTPSRIPQLKNMMKVWSELYSLFPNKITSNLVGAVSLKLVSHTGFSSY